ncbi:hypothetical protein JCM16303_002638 [Sporobolomyces ruberrimus]
MVHLGTPGCSLLQATQKRPGTQEDIWDLARGGYGGARIISGVKSKLTADCLRGFMNGESLVLLLSSYGQARGGIDVVIKDEEIIKKVIWYGHLKFMELEGRDPQEIQVITENLTPYSSLTASLTPDLH